MNQYHSIIVLSLRTVRQMKFCLTVLIIITSFDLIGQNTWDFTLESGITAYDYRVERWTSSLNGPKINNLTCPIFISGRVTNNSLNSSIQVSSYRNVLVSPFRFTGAEQSLYQYFKQQFDITYWYNWEHFSLGLGYTNMSFNHSMLQGRPNFVRGIGVAYSFDYFGVPFELRKDIAWDFYLQEPNLYEYWSFRSWVPILSTKEKKDQSDIGFIPKKTSMRLGFGLMTGLNPYSELMFEPSPFISIPYWETSLYIRQIRASVFFQKGVWLNNRVLSGQITNSGFSQFNYLGVNYLISLSDNLNTRYLKVGLSHGWLAERLFEWQQNPDVNFKQYQNKVISLDLGYPLAKNLEATLKADYYYASSEFNTTGINWERVRIGLRAYPFQ